MKIKTKTDAQILTDVIKSIDKNLKYETDSIKVTITFDNIMQRFIVIRIANNSIISSSTGSMSESYIIQMLFMDRKYINKIINTEEWKAISK